MKLAINDLKISIKFWQNKRPLSESPCKHFLKYPRLFVYTPYKQEIIGYSEGLFWARFCHRATQIQRRQPHQSSRSVCMTICLEPALCRPSYRYHSENWNLCKLITQDPAFSFGKTKLPFPIAFLTIFKAFL